MTTDIRTGLKTREEYIEGASIGYTPAILALPNLKPYTLEEDKITFKEFNVENDSINPSFLNSEMTDMNHAKVGGKIHIFNAYGKGLKLTKDLRRNGAIGIQTFHDQILRQFAIQFDRISMTGEGGNNGLITSSDPNYILNDSSAIPAVTGDGFNQIQAAKELATSLNLQVNNNTASTNLTVFFFGDPLLTFLGKITPGQENDVRYHIEQAFSGKTVTFIDISSLAIPSSLSLGNGIVVVSNDFVDLEHAGLPEIENDGVNEEGSYYWSRYLLGSTQVRPRILGGVINQPVTFS